MISLVIGKTCSGKSTYVNKLLMDSYNDKPMKRIIMYTTRPKRYGELNGVEYYFISDIDFINLDLSDQLLESKKYDVINPNTGDNEVWYYGTPILKDYKEQDYVCTATFDQVKAYNEQYGSENIKVYFIYCEETIRSQRALKRDNSVHSMEEFARRSKEENKEFTQDNIIELLKTVKNIEFIYNGENINEEAS